MLELLARYAALQTLSPADYASWLPDLSTMTTAQGHKQVSTLHISETPLKKRLTDIKAQAVKKQKIKVNPIVASMPNRRNVPVLRPRKSVITTLKSPQILRKKKPAFARKTLVPKTTLFPRGKLSKAEKKKFGTGIGHGKASQQFLKAARLLYDEVRKSGGSVVSIDTEGWQQRTNSMSEVGLEWESFKVSEIDGRVRKAAGARHCSK